MEPGPESPAIESFEFVSEVHWNAVYYGAMAEASAATESIQTETADISLPDKLRHVADRVHALAELIGNSTQGPIVPAAERVPLERCIEQFDWMLAAVDDLYRRCQRAGYTNHPGAAPALQSIYDDLDTIRDCNEHLRLIADPRTDKIFRRAREDRRTHGTIPMNDVF